MNLARAEFWNNSEDAAVSIVKQEERLRGGDTKIETCLLLEFLRNTAAQEATQLAMARLGTAEIGIYRLLCEQNNLHRKR